VTSPGPAFGLGHWTGKRTGVTVVLCPPGTVGSAEIRGGAPATRETALLDPSRTVEQVDAVVLSGGSAFGLAAADGVMAWLVEHGRGYATLGGLVPIVPAAAIYDLVVARAAGGAPPGPDEGRAAVEAASTIDLGMSGAVGAGAGATVGKWRGPDGAVAGGLGLAQMAVDDATLTAVAVVNAMGDVVADDGSVVAGSSLPASAPGFPELVEGAATSREATTLVAVMTDARCTKIECHLVAQSGQHGLGRAVRPSHTRHDGDIVFALGGSGDDAVETHLDRLRAAATEVVAEAIRNAVREPTRRSAPVNAGQE
jgi:L-aminopeptidase/D-esterase-like protein